MFFFFVGDIAFRFLKYLRNENDPSLENEEWTLDIPLDTEEHSHKDSVFENPGVSHVTVCDINQAMLDVGKKRAAESGYFKGTQPKKKIEPAMSSHLQWPLKTC